MRALFLGYLDYHLGLKIRRGLLEINERTLAKESFKNLNIQQ